MMDRSNVYHPSQPRELSTTFRYNPVRKRVEYWSWSEAAWDAVGDVWTPYPENEPSKQARYLRTRAQHQMPRMFGWTTYGKTYLEPIYTG